MNKIADAYKYRPECISIGCNKFVTYSNKSSAGLPTWRSHCGRCHEASGGRGTFAPGVTSIKKDYCENVDGRLGYICTSTIQNSCQLDLDHIDGEHYNHVSENIQTICKNCHSWKTKVEGDSVSASNQQRAA